MKTPATRVVTSANWQQWSNAIASPSDPIEYNEAAVKRLMKAIGSHVIDVKGVRTQFKAINKCVAIPFQSSEAAAVYNSYWARHQEEMERLGRTANNNNPLIKAVINNKFSEGAEFVRAEVMASKAAQDMENGFAAVIACKFKGTIAKVVELMIKNHGVKRKDISLIWGGYTSLTPGKTMSRQEIADILNKVMRGEQVADSLLNKIKKQLQQENSGLLNLPKEYELGNQTREQRQDEIDSFQRGVSRCCIFSFKAGGVGLSLHHCDDLTEYKVRRKKDSNWAYVEDIVNVPTRPRRVTVAPTYSAVELVQGLGRAERLSSLSDTEQTMLFYAGTVEEHLMRVVEMKLKCLRHVVRQRQSWEDIISSSEDDIKRTLQVDEEVLKGMSEDEIIASSQVGFTDVEEEEDEEVTTE